MHHNRPTHPPSMLPPSSSTPVDDCPKLSWRRDVVGNGEDGADMLGR
jgi:hypothetical protein